MDYKFIKNEFPFAWEELKENNFAKEGHRYLAWTIGNKPYVKNNRDLYTFFDEHDFFIEILPYNVNDWTYSIYRPYPNDDFALVHSLDGYLNREICEDAAFSKAFELLDKDLK